MPVGLAGLGAQLCHPGFPAMGAAAGAGTRPLTVGVTGPGAGVSALWVHPTRKPAPALQAHVSGHSVDRVPDRPSLDRPPWGCAWCCHRRGKGAPLRTLSPPGTVHTPEAPPAVWWQQVACLATSEQAPPSGCVMALGA